MLLACGLEAAVLVFVVLGRAQFGLALQDLDNASGALDFGRVVGTSGKLTFSEVM